MEFYKNLYVSESLRKRKEKILRKLKAGKGSLGCYIITLTKNPANQLEFFDSVLLQQKYERADSKFLVGIAGCYEEALQLVQKISEDTYEKRNDLNIREFILEQQGSRN